MKLELNSFMKILSKFNESFVSFMGNSPEKCQFSCHRPDFTEN